MKKTIRKLVVRRETIRAIRALEGIELARVGGGDTAGLDAGNSGGNCPVADELVATPARR